MKDADEILDVTIDAVRYVGMAIRAMMLDTGTPMDFVRDMLIALIEGSAGTSQKRGVARLWGAYDKVGEWIEGMRGGKSSGLNLQPRKDPPIAFHVVAWIHYTILAFCIAYPIIFSKDAGWDCIFLIYIAIVVMHWFIFCGECIFLYFEKKLFYEQYEMGWMPNLYWFSDSLPWQLSLAIVLTSVLGINSSVMTVLLRNVSFAVSLDRDSITASLSLCR